MNFISCSYSSTKNHLLSTLTGKGKVSSDRYGILKIISSKDLKDQTVLIQILKSFYHQAYMKNSFILSAWNPDNPYDLLNERICQLNLGIMSDDE